MANVIIKQTLLADDKVELMNESAKYDMADYDDIPALVLNSLTNIKAPKAPPKVPKVFVSNDCIFNCSYCGCRSGICSKQRYTNKPDEMAKIAIQQAENNPSKGVFVTSGIYRNPDYTEELIIDTLRKMRFKYGYTGFIHAKIMPGTDPDLIEEAGWLADRLSINIELPKSAGYSVIAKQKNKDNILKPMGNISKKIISHTGERNIFGRNFSKAGQTTQVIVGAMKEDDRTTLTLAEAMYRKYKLRRVYYSPFGVPRSEKFEFFPDKSTPFWRTRRMYQADRLIQLYNFSAEDILPESSPNMQYDIDPKSAWALRNIHLFPVEVNKADYSLLIKVPGIGVTSARKIVELRRSCTISHAMLRKIGVQLKKSRFFITCAGKYDGGKALEAEYLRDLLCDTDMRLSLFETI